MNTNKLVKSAMLAAALLPVGLLACAETTPPRELVFARAEMVRARRGPAAQLDPTDIHEAQLALDRAEAAFANDPTSPVTADLAAVAWLDAQSAEAVAGTMQANNVVVRAQANMQAVEAAKLDAANTAVQRGKDNLAQSQGQLEQQRQETANERAERVRAETQLKDARDTLARIANVKNDDRGLVVTFQGESLFVTAQSSLLPSAMVKLDQVAEALRGRERKIDVIGYTDSQGGVGQYNQDLSEKRAAAVRDYLVAKGVPSDLIRSEGRGATEFVADNTSIEGRAANRRVEIVVEAAVPR